jgi:hypothetical protein
LERRAAGGGRIHNVESVAVSAIKQTTSRVT